MLFLHMAIRLLQAVLASIALIKLDIPIQHI